MTDKKKHHNPIPTTDVIIEYNDGLKEGIILIDRINLPYGLAIPGGYAEYGKSFEKNAIKEAEEETGLEVILLDNKPLCVQSDPDRDPRGHMASIVYLARGTGELKKGIFDDARDPTLYSLDEVAELIKSRKLAFDHGEILQKYLVHRGHSK